MLLGTTGLPYSFFSLLCDSYTIVNDRNAHRPDNVVNEAFGGSVFVESFCNEISNVSPFSFTKDIEYLIPSRLLLKTFLEVG